MGRFPMWAAEVYDWYEKFPRILMPYVFARPTIKIIKSLDKTDLIGVEIGTYLGENAKNMLRFLSINKLYLIDPYVPYCTSYRTFYLGDAEFEKVQKNLAKFSEKIVFIRKTSENAINNIPNNLDFVYIDGNHDYEFVKRDINLYYSKVKRGGLIGGHDFSASFMGVCRAIVEFANENSLELRGFNSDWWILK